jgi:hypothetical protein
MSPLEDTPAPADVNKPCALLPSGALPNVVVSGSGAASAAANRTPGTALEVAS